MSNSNKNKESHAPVAGEAKSDANRVILYSFSEQGKGNWREHNDVVMGGQSESQLKITSDNHAHFSGRVSLENNGGFCSIHQVLEDSPYNIPDNSNAFLLLLNGDGKDYKFRVRTPNGQHLYGFTFPTQANGKWETISVPFNAMEASYHGEPVDVPNYAGENVLEMQLLIGNKKEETFEVLIESIMVI